MDGNDQAQKAHQFSQRWAKALCFFIFLLCFYWAFQAGLQAYNLPIKHVHVEGPFRYVTERDIVNMTKIALQKTFLALNLIELKKQLLKQSWIKDANVTKQWPDTLLIQITEENPLVHWQKDYILNEESQNFHRHGKVLNPDIPYLSGPHDQASFVLYEFKRMNIKIREIGLQIKRCELSERQAWTLELDNGMKLRLGKQAYFERLSRFVRAYRSIFLSETMHADWIDLSYPSGMAIRWREEQT